jgi:hypothetical protein
MYLVFEMGITHFADVSYLTARKWPEGFTCLGGGVVESISQWFFAMRLLKASSLMARWQPRQYEADLFYHSISCPRPIGSFQLPSLDP